MGKRIADIDTAADSCGGKAYRGNSMKKLIVALFCASFVIPAIAEARGGHYAGGHGSSHKGGQYKNSRTGDHYEKRR
ncbi:hypothetical protein [Caballeronia catudaia]|uniref:hypothetical protein n=1 Tax=Caballeronia catudaia TaxID=1777136 RepID=UPI001F3DB58A|nr:hypothetical protein [Caballeronia catudaia]